MIQKQYKKALFIFRRDLRLIDNSALNEALRLAESVITIFNFDPAQVGAKNSYRSMNSLQFMIESLQELAAGIRKKKGKLHFFYGDTIKNVASLIKDQKIDALFINADYTPFALKRDSDLKKLCHRHGIEFHTYHDLLLIGNPQSVMTGKGTPYTIYTPFLKNAVKLSVPAPERLTMGHFSSAPIKNEADLSIFKKVVSKKNPAIKMHGGRKNGMAHLKRLSKYKNYAQDRNIPAIDKTTHLSAAHKFGTISIRESYHAIRKTLGVSDLLKELYWRDFFTYIAYHTPSVFGHPFNKKYSNLVWSNNHAIFKRWCTGTTGFPIVDAGMRQLNTTGWMHNRVRMIVASFLIKDMHINWLWGERYFAQQLVDYDPAVNNGNWQWAASTGADALPYFRIFNPWIQQKKFDPDCYYIKQWIPELADIAPKIIHNWFKKEHSTIKQYPRPILDHTTESKKAIMLYR